MGLMALNVAVRQYKGIRTAHARPGVVLMEGSDRGNAMPV